MIQYTSGTSGQPKGVMLTHGNVVWNVYNLLVDIDLGSDEIALVTAPLFHTAALNQVLFPTVLKGGTALIEARFDPARAIDLIERERVTLLFGVTTMYLALSQSPRFHEADLSSLHLALSGGSPIPESLLQTWLDRGLMIVQGYGLTEASPGTTMLRAADGVRKLGSAGTACFFTDVRGASIDDRDADVGEPGEVLVRGPNVTPGLLAAIPTPPTRAFARRLAAHRRPRHPRRRGLPAHRRPAQGHVHLRRRERLSGRGRAGDVHAPGGGRVRGHRRRPTPPGARSATRSSSCATGQRPGRGRTAAPPRVPAGALQGAEVGRVRRRPAAQRVRQTAQVPAARRSTR